MHRPGSIFVADNRGQKRFQFLKQELILSTLGRFVKKKKNKKKKQIHNRKIINVEVNKVLEIQFHFQMHPKTATSIFALRIASTWHHIELHTWQTCPRGKKQLTLSIYNVHLFL